MSSFFGLDSVGRFVFVSEVPRGLACQCRCVVCNEPLIARQGAVREHHFAHASGREPCEVSHESLLHRYAKQVIQEAGGLAVPVNSAVVEQLGLNDAESPSAMLELQDIDVERSVQDLRPDLLGHTDAGIAIAIEVAYSSFCDLLKADRFAQLGLPALEIDLRAFTPEGFEPEAVRAVVLHDIAAKTWLWPKPPVGLVPEPVLPPAPPTAAAVVDAPRRRLPEEIVTISGRWVSIKEFPSGDIAVKVITYDPDVVSMVKTIAKANYARYSPQWKSWNVPRWRAETVRLALRSKVDSVSIVLQDRG
jgi:competence protein CoiA